MHRFVLLTYCISDPPHEKVIGLTVRGDDVPAQLTVILIVGLLGKTCDFEGVGNDLKASCALGWAAGTRHGIDGARLRELKMRGDQTAESRWSVFVARVACLVISITV